MNSTQIIEHHTDSATWPEGQPIADARVIAGSPTTSTIAMDHKDDRKFGLWRATPGAFTTDHAGYTEFIHVVEGRGRLVSDQEVITELRPGTSVVIPSGWRGRWEIDQTLTKIYAVTPGPA